MSKRTPIVLIFSPSPIGGVAEHTYYQANALEKAGAKIVCLISPSFLKGRKTTFKKVTCLPDPLDGPPSMAKKIMMAWRIIFSRYVLAFQVIKYRPDLVLLDSYVEYLSPLWIDLHLFLSKVCRFRYAANLHDHVRSYVIGPTWWHRLSVWLAYLPLDFVLVHDKMPESSPIPCGVSVIEVPHGVYEINNLPSNTDEIRCGWGAREGQKIFLSFGYVRNGKNLDLVIRALTEVQEAFLVVVGKVASGNDKPFSYYTELASMLGVDGRCRFFEGFVSDEELGKYFAGTDFVLLTYSSDFHSQSGVLNIAAKARKPVLASASPSPLIESVRNYSLGIAIPPDSLDSVIDGMKSLIKQSPQPNWEDYEASASWDLNARKILEAATCFPSMNADISSQQEA